MSPVLRPRSLTGVKPTGTPHIGNYLGAIRPAIELAGSHDSFLFIADFHALTTQHDPRQLEEETYVVAATWLALGLDPSKVVFYKQSDVPETATLAWILSCFTPMGFLERGHSVKDARSKSEKEINHGVFYYPVLMAADILLYDADIVPVGKDQKQHLEITQEIARKFNHHYGEVLKIPKPQIDERVMTVPGIDGQKMSKSYGNGIDIFASSDGLKKRISKIKTDLTPLGSPLPAEGDIIFSLFKLFASEAETTELLARYTSGRTGPGSSEPFGWGLAKAALLERMDGHLAPHRAEYLRLMDDRPYLRKLLLEGADKARAVASVVLSRVSSAVGFVR